MVTFIRIPKNASTSIYSYFGGKNTIRNELLSADNDMHLNIFESSHRTIEDAAETLGRDILDCPVLAVTRNPFDRLVSMFFFARKHDIGQLYGINTEDFDQFASDFKGFSGVDTFFHAFPQTKYIKGASNLTVARFENLEEDIKDFIENNGLSFEGGLPRLNATKHNDYREYYTPESRAIVCDMWGSDLDEFEYSFN